MTKFNLVDSRGNSQSVVADYVVVNEGDATFYQLTDVLQRKFVAFFSAVQWVRSIPEEQDD